MNPGNCAPPPKRHQRGNSNANAAACWLVGICLGIIGQSVGYEDFMGITRPCVAVAEVEEFGECDFSLLAICRSR